MRLFHARYRESYQLLYLSITSGVVLLNRHAPLASYLWVEPSFIAEAAAARRDTELAYFWPCSGRRLLCRRR